MNILHVRMWSASSPCRPSGFTQYAAWQTHATTNRWWLTCNLYDDAQIWEVVLALCAVMYLPQST